MNKPKKYHEVHIYVEPGSKLCELTKLYFRDAGMDYMELDITRNPIARDRMYEISEQKRTPVTELDERVIVGYRPDVFDIILAQDTKISTEKEKDADGFDII
jgi:arsenate reductase-like glutaredoxin family protein